MFSSPTAGVCKDQANQSMQYFGQQTGLFDSNADGESSCFDFCSRYMDIPGFAGFQWNDLDGAASFPGLCVCFFDAGSTPAGIGNEIENFMAGYPTNPGFGPLAGDGKSGRTCHSFLGIISRSSRYGSGMMSSRRTLSLTMLSSLCCCFAFQWHLLQ